MDKAFYVEGPTTGLTYAVADEVRAAVEIRGFDATVTEHPASVVARTVTEDGDNEALTITVGRPAGFSFDCAIYTHTVNGQVAGIVPVGLNHRGQIARASDITHAWIVSGDITNAL